MSHISSSYPLANGERLIGNNLSKDLVGDGEMYLSQTNTLLKTMTVCFKEDQKFLSLSFVKEKGMKEYLQAQGFNAEDIWDATFYTTKPTEIKRLFELIVTNNILDLNEVNRLRRLLQTDFADTGMKTYHTSRRIISNPSRERLINKNLSIDLVGQGGLYQSQTETFTMSLCLKEDEKFLCIFYVQNKGMKEYLEAQGFAAEDGSFHTTKPAEMRKLFELIVANNDLELNEVNRLRSLLQRDFADTGMKTNYLPNQKINK